LVMVTCQRPVLTLSGWRLLAAKRAVVDNKTALSKIIIRISSSLRFLVPSFHLFGPNFTSEANAP
jgi:hypothetical protein